MPKDPQHGGCGIRWELYLPPQTHFRCQINCHFYYTSPGRNVKRLLCGIAGGAAGSFVGDSWDISGRYEQTVNA